MSNAAEAPPPPPIAAPAPGAPAPQAQGGFVQPGQAAQPSPLAQTFTAWFRGPGLTSTALSLAIVLGSAAISAILTMVAMSTMDTTKMFPTTFSTLPLLMGWSLGGQFVMSGSNEYETITLTFTLLPMGALTAAGIGVFWLARRRAAVDGSAAPLVPTLARAGAEALAVALVACLVTAPFSMTAKMMGLKVMTVSSSALMTILLVTVVVFVALMVARSGGALLERLPSPVVQIGRELGALSTALGVVLGVFVIVAYIVAALTQGWNLASILLLPVVLPNLVLLVLGVGSLGGITLDKSEAAAALAYFLPSLGGKDGGDAYAWTWFGSWSILLFAAMIVAIAAAAVRVGVRRARTGRAVWQRVWQLPLVSLVLGAIAFYGLLPLRFSGADTPMRSSGGGAGHYMSLSMQPNALTFLLLGVVVAIISVLAELLPLWVYSSFPAVLQLAGGKKASAAWRAGTSGVSPTASAQQWAYSTDPATGASIATDPATGAVFSMDPATGQWVETTPASQAPAPGFGGVAAAGATASGELPEPAPMSAASRKKVILGLSVFGVVVALVVAGVVALNVVNGMRGPDKAVESYLTLLSEGKASEATKMVDPGVPNDQRKLLTDDALKAAKARIKVTKIDKPTISDDTATIKAHLSLDGKAFEYNFTASKTSGSFGLDSWKVDKPLVVSADFSSSSFPGLKVAGVAIDLAKGKDGLSGYRSTQVVYPGVYPVAAPDSVSKYLTAKETSFTLIPSGEGVSAEAESVGTQTVDATPTDELKTKALEKVKEQTKTCATVPTNTDKPCPFQISSDMTSLSVEKDATKVEFSKDSNDLSFTSDEIIISGSPKPSAFDKNPTPRKAKFTFSGKVELPEGGGEPTITIESNSSVF
ncbi:hypothetical protein BKH23_12080 [Actinomyces oris]|nr:hypothetical protein BKH23_12080 [Actinomyces oris]